jgi:PRC-barrel domain
MEAMMQTDAASGGNRNLIASDRVEGIPVRSKDGTPIGTIERVMTDMVTGNIAYAILSLYGSVGVGQKQVGDPPSDASDKDFDRGGRERYWGIAETW